MLKNYVSKAQIIKHLGNINYSYFGRFSTLSVYFNSHLAHKNGQEELGLAGMNNLMQGIYLSPYSALEQSRAQTEIRSATY